MKMTMKNDIGELVDIDDPSSEGCTRVGYRGHVSIIKIINNYLIIPNETRLEEEKTYI